MVILLFGHSIVLDNCQSGFTVKGNVSFSKLMFELVGRVSNSYVRLSILINHPLQHGEGHILTSCPVIIPIDL